MSEASRREVRAGLEPSLARLWRYALVLSRARDTADDLVQATCLRAIERADQFVPGTRVDRWLFAILRRSGSMRSDRDGFVKAAVFVDAADALTTDGEREIEMNITAAAVLRAIDRLPEAQRLRNALSRRSALSSGFREYRRLLGAPPGQDAPRLRRSNELSDAAY
jgi:RNA polymerase sigma-70 factor (ECF subfamily)